MTVVVVGFGSMIAGALRRHPKASSWRYLRHAEALSNAAWVRNASVVINLAFDPRLKSEDYSPELDFDLKLAQILPAGVRYIIASTRMAYGPAGSSGRLSEEMPSNPANPYGRSKLVVERVVDQILRDRLTIIRLSNVFDISEICGQRRSFLGMATRRLVNEGRIVFDISPFVERDFLPADVLADRLVAIAEKPMPGLFNMGAGFGVPTGRIAQWLISGYGSGELLVTDVREHDNFWLDMDRSRNTWDFPVVSAEDIRRECLKIGQEARKCA